VTCSAAGSQQILKEEAGPAAGCWAVMEQEILTCGHETHAGAVTCLRAAMGGGRDLTCGVRALVTKCFIAEDRDLM
jgi:hypothetical protein